MKFLSAILMGLACLSVAGHAMAQQNGAIEVPFKVDADSRINLTGRSTVGPYSCQTDDVKGTGKAGQTLAGEGFVEAHVSTEVVSFDCGNGKMTADLQRALDGDTFPVVSYAIDNVFIRTSTEYEGGDYSLRATGTFSIAGVERNVDLHLIAEKEGFISYRLTGTQEIRMSDFEVEPPSALLGIIRAEDALTVEFDLLLTPTTGWFD